MHGLGCCVSVHLHTYVHRPDHDRRMSAHTSVHMCVHMRIRMSTRKDEGIIGKKMAKKRTIEMATRRLACSRLILMRYTFCMDMRVDSCPCGCLCMCLSTGCLSTGMCTTIWTGMCTAMFIGMHLRAQAFSTPVAPGRAVCVCVCEYFYTRAYPHCMLPARMPIIASTRILVRTTFVIRQIVLHR